MTAHAKPILLRGRPALRRARPGCVLTIGSFDGVHLGHQAILAQVVEQARTLNLPACAMVFEPQPFEFFSGEQAPARLMSLREKVQALFAAGMDRVICLPFNNALRSLKAQAFIEQILVEEIGVQALIIGDDFRFGCDRSGNYQVLQQAGQQYGFSVRDTLTHEIEGQRVSSTRIRAALEQQRFEHAAQLLGKPYSISGKVIYGQQLGRQLGVPTANVRLRRFRSPLRGVYAICATLDDGRRFQGVANVGVRPTVDGLDKPILEVHLFDFNEQIYAQRLQVQFACKLRDEHKFPSLEALKAQLADDIAQARQFFAQQSSKRGAQQTVDEKET